VSGTFPSSPSPSTFDLRSLQPTRVSISQSLKRQVRTTGAQRWAGTLSWLPQLRASMAPVLAFLAAQEGQFGSFQIVLPPPYDTPQGSWAGTPVVNGASQVGGAIALRGFTPSAANVVKAGDVFKFAGDTKVYMATADANANGAGQASVSIKPRLIVSPADGEGLVYTSVPFTVMQAGDLVEMAARPGASASGLYTWTLALMEAY
jgi:hypothetical protein